jgi:hypothetical protein
MYVLVDVLITLLLFLGTYSSCYGGVLGIRKKIKVYND